MQVIGESYDGDLNLTGVTVEEDGEEYRLEIVRHGRWTLKSVKQRSFTIDEAVYCPECGNHFYRITGTWFKHCPECGTKMDLK